MEAKGQKLSIFGLTGKNAGCFWDWTIFKNDGGSQTRELLERTADMRLRLHLDCRQIERMGLDIIETLEEVG